MKRIIKKSKKKNRHKFKRFYKNTLKITKNVFHNHSIEELFNTSRGQGNTEYLLKAVALNPKCVFVCRYQRDVKSTQQRYMEMTNQTTVPEYPIFKSMGENIHQCILHRLPVVVDLHCLVAQTPITSQHTEIVKNYEHKNRLMGWY